MKKVETILLIFVLSILLVGCGTDPVAKKVMDDIESIGTVELSDKEMIESISETYKELTDKQKNQVKNYATLLEAQDKIKQLEKEAEQAAILEEIKKRNSTEYDLAISAIQMLKDSLFNSESLQLKDVSYYSAYEGGSCYIKVDYSGENRLGGMVSDSVIFYSYHGDEIDGVYTKETSSGLEKYNMYKDKEYTELDIDFIEKYLE